MNTYKLDDHDPPDTRPDAESLDLAVEVFRMLADATRVALLWELQSGERSVGDLVASLDKPQALVSQHLAKLRMARLVSSRRQGNQVFYGLANRHVQHLVVDGVHHAEHVVTGSLDIGRADALAEGER